MNGPFRRLLLATVAVGIGAGQAVSMPIQPREGTPAVGAKRSMTYHGARVGRDIKPMQWVAAQEPMAMRIGDVQFTVRVENRADAAPISSADGASVPAGFSHGNYAVFGSGAPIFVPQTPASGGLERLAEDGNVRPLQSELEQEPGVLESGIFYKPVGADHDQVLVPGDAYEFIVTANPGNRLSFAMMLLQSNDIFVGPSNGWLALFDRDGQPISGDVTAQLQLFDAGTELNQDPKHGSDTGPNQSGLDVGPVEMRPITEYDGGAAYPAVSRMLKVSITPG